MLGCDVAPKLKADNRVLSEGEDGYFNGTTGLPAELHDPKLLKNWYPETGYR